METLRFPIIALFVFAATFFIAYQITAPRPLEPDPRVPTFQQRAAEEERHRMEATSSASDNDAVRDRLRLAVLDGAKSLGCLCTTHRRPSQPHQSRRPAPIPKANAT